MNWNFQEILIKDPSSAWGCDTSGNVPPCGVALRRTCRCTEFHRVKNASLRHPSAMCCYLRLRMTVCLTISKCSEYYGIVSRSVTCVCQLQHFPGFINAGRRIEMNTAELLFRAQLFTNVLMLSDIRKHCLDCGSNMIHMYIPAVYNDTARDRNFSVAGKFPFMQVLYLKFRFWNSKIFPLKTSFLYARFPLRQVSLSPSLSLSLSLCVPEFKK